MLGKALIAGVTAVVLSACQTETPPAAPAPEMRVLSMSEVMGRRIDPGEHDIILTPDGGFQKGLTMGRKRYQWGAAQGTWTADDSGGFCPNVTGWKQMKPGTQNFYSGSDCIRLYETRRGAVRCRRYTPDNPRTYDGTCPLGPIEDDYHFLTHLSLKALGATLIEPQSFLEQSRARAFLVDQVVAPDGTRFERKRAPVFRLEMHGDSALAMTLLTGPARGQTTAYPFRLEGDQICVEDGPLKGCALIYHAPQSGRYYAVGSRVGIATFGGVLEK